MVRQTKRLPSKAVSTSEEWTTLVMKFSVCMFLLSGCCFNLKLLRWKEGAWPSWCLKKAFLGVDQRYIYYKARENDLYIYIYIFQYNIKQEKILNLYVWPTVKMPVSKFLFRFHLDWTMSRTCTYLIRYCALKTNMWRSNIYYQYSQPARITSRSRFH